MTINVISRVILSGSLGQLGVEVARFLREIYGRDNVIMSDIIKPSKEIFNDGSYILSLDLLGIFVYTEYGGSSFLRNVGELLPDCMTLHPR
jgi:hypothetical protein